MSKAGLGSAAEIYRTRSSNSATANPTTLATTDADGSITVTNASQVVETPPVIRAILSGAEMRRLQTNNDKLAESGIDPFPGQGSVGLYTKHLLGYPFVFASDLSYRTDETGKFGPQQVVQTFVRFSDPASESSGDAVLATLQGAYLLNQLRSMTDNERAMHIWTIAPHPELRTIGGKPPLMLKRYDSATDAPPDSAF